jgi:hypothetical protein
MKDFQNFTDLFAIAFGMIGSLIKGIRAKFNFSTILLGMLIAGIMTYSIIGIIEIYYSETSPKVIILISFCVGWVSNEITTKLDLVVGDIYEIFIQWIKNQFTKTKKP